ncbi:MAG: hypothetical protein NTX47_02305 [Candidatus Omnitrophica bacterium]|nr:hypothetical protein [Candidatus Omnitrophota bacterium]
MKDAIEKILKEEERAGKILQDAKEEAERIARDAKKEKENIIDRAAIEADDSSHKEKEKSEKRFMSEKENVLKAVREETLAIKERKDKDISEVSKKIFSRIITIED